MMLSIKLDIASYVGVYVACVHHSCSDDQFCCGNPQHGQTGGCCKHSDDPPSAV